jgi:uncharacterized protein (TIGR03086 family)
MTIDPVELHRRAIDEFGRRVEAIADNQWGLPTPCADWDVRALVHHLVYENVWAPALFEGQTVEQVGDRFEGDLLGGEPEAAWKDSAQQALGAVSRPGAMAQTVHLSFGDFPGEAYAMQLTTDLAVHAWDLARGIGADDRLDPELVEACYAAALPMEPMLRQSGMFGDKVDVGPDADTQAKLLGMMGRTP